MRKHIQVSILYRLIKNRLTMCLFCFILCLNAQDDGQQKVQEDTIVDPSLETLDTLVNEIKQTLLSNTLTSVERDQCYDVIGSLGLCRPVIQVTLERSADLASQRSEATPNSESISDQTAQHQNPHSEHTLITKFDLLKQHLVQQLVDQKMDANQQESAYTLIGSLNLCRPILIGANTLLDKMKVNIAPDQLAPMTASEHPMPTLNPIEDIP